MRMTFRDYSDGAMRTASDKQDHDDRLLNAALGLAGEVGEVVEHIKKYSFHNQPLEVRDVLREAGDVLWYLNLLVNTLESNLETVAEDNLLKLERRHPEAFSSDYCDEDPFSVDGPEDLADLEDDDVEVE
jgi:NTP pyrophosphatase (non-canonical NTP hydrolase)